MARPNNATNVSLTPLGTRFQWDLEVMTGKGARDAAVDQLMAIVAEQDRNAFLRECVGYTTWNGTTRLQRVLPLRHPTRPELWCDEYNLYDYGAYEARADFGDPLNNFAPVQDWYRYVLTFVRPKMTPLTDDQLMDPAVLPADALGKEQFRYTESSDLPQPEMRIVSGFGYQYLDPNTGLWVDVPDERQSIPTYKIATVVTWRQIPLRAIPYGAILECLNTVNSLAITLHSDGTFWLPGKLGFQGLAKPIERYVGADGAWYVDLCYRWVVRPGNGWNFWPARKADGTVVYQPVREKATLLPQFLSTDHQKLFRPGA